MPPFAGARRATLSADAEQPLDHLFTPALCASVLRKSARCVASFSYLSAETVRVPLALQTNPHQGSVYSSVAGYCFPE